MALATSVEGTGKLISSQKEGSGQYRYNRTEIVDGDEVVNQHTITYTELRQVRKWYALTEAAATGYQTSNPTLNTTVECVNEKTGAYELTAETLVRTVVSHGVAAISEAT